MADKPVYSSKKGDLRESKHHAPAFERAEGPTKMRLETAGRGGKAVTVLFNLPFAESEARTLMKELQTLLGVGATLKESCIELRGDHRDRVAAFFAKRGLVIKRAGG